MLGQCHLATPILQAEGNGITAVIGQWPQWKCAESPRAWPPLTALAGHLLNKTEEPQGGKERVTVGCDRQLFTSAHPLFPVPQLLDVLSHMPDTAPWTSALMGEEKHPILGKSQVLCSQAPGRVVGSEEITLCYPQLKHGLCQCLRDNSG
jgi:hypothetical protein